MPKVMHVKSARKDGPKACPSIKAGEEYYYWGTKVGGRFVTRCSKTYPKPSQLTSSAFLSLVYEIEEALAREEFSGMSPDDILLIRDDYWDQVESLIDETRYSLEAMPEHLQDADTGQLLQGRIDGCEEWAECLAGVDFHGQWDGQGDEPYDYSSAVEDFKSELMACTPSFD